MTIKLGFVKGPQVKLTCENCGKYFFVYPYREKTAKFCNRSCGSGSRTMQSHNAWKGGRSRMKNGYIRVRINGKYIYEHRYIMENFLNRKLEKTECVHHINGNRIDNRVENLIVLEKSIHDSMETKRRFQKNPHWQYEGKERCGAIITERHRKGQLCKRVKPCRFHII